MKIITNNSDDKNISKINNVINFNIKLFENKKTNIILGNFDGVHKAHQKIIKEAVTFSKKNKLLTILYNFYNPPIDNKKNLTTLEEKIELLKKFNIDYYYLENFFDVKNFSPEFFINYLKEKFNANSIFCGFNYSFGLNKAGDISLLSLYNNDNFRINVISEIKDDINVAISSTRIRKIIEKNNLNEVEKLLGHNIIIIGEVIHGRKIARQLGFPTANLKYEKKLYPPYGVYGVSLKIDNDSKKYFGVLNIGENPTLKQGELSVEVHILNFSDDLYGKTIKIEILEKIRKEKKFNSVNDLIKSIKNDTIEWTKKVEEVYGNKN